METTKLYIAGASGHGRVVHSLAKSLGYEIIAFLDDYSTDEKFDGLPVLKEYSHLGATEKVIIAVGVNNTRQKIVEGVNFQFETLIHPQALIDDKVSIGEGTIICRGSIVQVATHIGNHSIVNSGASVDHDCVVGNYVHIAPNATICGGVEVGNNTWVGAGAVITQYLKIGANVMIGAGAVVLTDIPDNAVVVGNPAKIIKYQ